ncbi:protein PET117 homolog, mitochondrial-like [Anneissia japonica]|uniref:protein PET117 homolog, mitochondrial-like n=1 Tax=Anneissia japonica TaxID=1529436 RepID=UPI001425B7E0|nr:protein PET117 homolog, mitochondrial-like [Anneissia japonica]
MSLASKITLGASVVIATATVFGVHYKKSYDQKRLKQGVVKDLERQERKRRNREELQHQIELTQRLEMQRDQQEGTSKHKS